MARRCWSLVVAGVSTLLLQGCGEGAAEREHAGSTRAWHSQAAHDPSLSWDAAQWDDAKWL